ncbi:hypothetical protein [Actinomadura roseirufa]|uniref:hypothetical protein n=1 Tax=Actinomadura roseirufa TaxID=2094049 RepID=UPI0010417F2E|nr:hypothetical protein [Actinomadura roseirufa]
MIPLVELVRMAVMLVVFGGACGVVGASMGALAPGRRFRRHRRASHVRRQDAPRPVLSASQVMRGLAVASPVGAPMEQGGAGE